MFDEAVAETFKLMEGGSFPRFLRDMKSMHGSLTPDNPEQYGAPFAVPLVRDGCSLGVLRGLLALTSIDSTMSKVRCPCTAGGPCWPSLTADAAYHACGCLLAFIGTLC